MYKAGGREERKGIYLTHEGVITKGKGGKEVEEKEVHQRMAKAWGGVEESKCLLWVLFCLLICLFWYVQMAQLVW